MEGNNRSKTVPFAGSLHTLMWPPIDLMNAHTCGSPNPVPRSPLVVKSGLKIQCSTSSVMPLTGVLHAHPHIKTGLLRPVHPLSDSQPFSNDSNLAAARHPLDRDCSRVCWQNRHNLRYGQAAGFAIPRHP